MTAITVQIGSPGCGKTYQLALEAAKAAQRYGHDRVIACSLSRTGAKQAARTIELPYDQYATIHGFAYRALGSPELAEAHIDEWNTLYPQWELSGGKRTADDAYDRGSSEKPGDHLRNTVGFDQA